MIRNLLLSLFAFFALSAQAQNDSTKIAIAQINSIKLDAEHYLYAEVTMPDWFEAYNAAKALLKEQLASWLTNQHQEKDVTSYIARSDEHIFEIKALRGNRYRAFVYMKKSDVLAIKEERQLLTVSSEEVHDKAAEETLFKVPAEAPASAAAPVAGAPAPVSAPVAASASAKNPLETDMLTVNSFNDIEPFIRHQESMNVVTTFGKYANRPSTGTYYMFVYNRDAEIPAYLRYDDGKIFNLKTGREDSMEAYKNCGAIWFK